MKKAARTLLIAGFCLASLAACQSFQPDPEITSGSTVSLIVDHNCVMTYDPLTWQSSSRTPGNEYRVFSDDASRYYKLTLERKPSTAGEKISGSLEWNDGGGKQNRDSMGFEVQRIDGSLGCAWLWCRKAKTGVAIIL